MTERVKPARININDIPITDIFGLHLHDIDDIPVGVDYQADATPTPEQLSLGHLRLSINLATGAYRRQTGECDPYPDVVQDAYEMMVRRARKYDPTRGKFSTYLVNCLPLALNTRIVQNRPPSTLSLSELTFDDGDDLRDVRDDTARDPLDIVLEREKRDAIDTALDLVPARTERMMRMYFGLDGNGGLTEQEIADKFGFKTRANSSHFIGLGINALRRDSVFMNSV